MVTESTELSDYQS